MNKSIFYILEKVFDLSFYLIFFFVPFIFIPTTSELFEINKMFAVFVLTIIIVGMWTAKIVLTGMNPVKAFRRTFLDIPLLLFFVSQVMSTVLSIDVHTSIWGYYSRLNGGLLSTGCYILLYWAWVSNMNHEKTIKAIKYLLVAVAFISLWAILEHFGKSPSCLLIRREFNTSCWVQDVQNRVFATLGQPNWLAAWLVAILPLSWALFLTKKGDTKWSYFYISILIFLALLFTKSRSGLLGFGAAAITFTLLSFYSKKFKLAEIIKSLTIIFLPLALALLVFGSIATPSLSSFFGQKEVVIQEQLSGTSLDRGGTESGTIRKIVWQGAINIWRAYPVFGSGVETFGYSYYNYRPISHNYTSEWELLYNKAHNEYLNYLANTGAVGLLTYIIIIGAFTFYVFKNLKLPARRCYASSIAGGKIENSKAEFENTQNLIIALFAGFVSILVTNFFGFSVVPVSLLFFLYPALAVAISEPVIGAKGIASSRLTYKKIVLGALALGAIIFLLIRILSVWSADFLYADSISLTKKGLDSQAFSKIRSALEKRMDEPNYYDQLAKVSANRAIIKFELQDSTTGAELASLAEDATRVATSISPYHVGLLKSQSNIFIKLSEIDIKYLREALKPLEKAVHLAPTDPKMRYNIGVLYSRLGDTERAQLTLEQTVNLKTDYYDARVGLAKIYADKKDFEKARLQYEFILKNINPNDTEIKEKLNSLPK